MSASSEWLSLLQGFDWKNQTVQRSFKQKLVEKRDHVPSYLQGAFWKRILLTNAPYLLSIEEYNALLSAEDFKFESEIQRDVNRTFPELKFFKEKHSYGQVELYNVLKAFTILNPEVGYCQGMGFIAGILLSHMNEIDTFNCFTVLMSEKSEYRMGGLYKPGLPLLSKFLTQFQAMIETELPDLWYHFQNQGIEVSMFGSQWILSLFIYNLHYKKSVFLFNLFLLFNYRVILLFGVFVLEEMESTLLGMNFEEILCRINNIDDLVNDMDDFVQWLEEEDGWEIGLDRSSSNESTTTQGPRKLKSSLPV